ncbi:hypothetical protein COLO4_20604 [Corchorus olitorius]|uniref:Uncharacterized protein n=1 Tax=Corchorus olitorius TaxID=93759 RepID=A0A1R3IYR7_9ROSI|nr:hypothetical protein COLO4_20604 [Corchorus olitorius]
MAPLHLSSPPQQPCEKKNSREGRETKLQRNKNRQNRGMIWLCKTNTHKTLRHTNRHQQHTHQKQK